MESKTPIVDSMCRDDYVDTGWLLDCARKLETDRAALIAALDEMLADAETMREPYRNEAICEKARATLAAVQP